MQPGRVGRELAGVAWRTRALLERAHGWQTPYALAAPIDSGLRRKLGIPPGGYLGGQRRSFNDGIDEHQLSCGEVSDSCGGRPMRCELHSYALRAWTPAIPGGTFLTGPERFSEIRVAQRSLDS